MEKETRQAELEKEVGHFENRDRDIIERYENDELYEDDEWELLLNYKMNVAELKGIKEGKQEAQAETQKIIDEWAKSYDENHPIFFESIERLKSMVKNGL